MRTAAAAVVLVATRGVMPALADRTGRFSTRLTARRRYLPRVRAGVEAVRARAAGDLSTPPVAQTMEDLLPPARLLASGTWVCLPLLSCDANDYAYTNTTTNIIAVDGTGSVGEGAAAAPKRAKLKETLDELEQYAAKADSDPAAMTALLKAIDDYADSIGLDDTLPAS